jgi:hypothetical protein
MEEVSRKHSHMTTPAPTAWCPTRRQSRPELPPWSHIPLEHTPATDEQKSVRQYSPTATLIRTHFHVARPPVEIEVKIFDLAILSELFCHVLLRRLFMDISNQNDPPFDR